MISVRSAENSCGDEPADDGRNLRGTEAAVVVGVCCSLSVEGEGCWVAESWEGAAGAEPATAVRRASAAAADADAVDGETLAVAEAAG